MDDNNSRSNSSMWPVYSKILKLSTQQFCSLLLLWVTKCIHSNQLRLLSLDASALSDNKNCCCCCCIAWRDVDSCALSHSYQTRPHTEKERIVHAPRNTTTKNTVDPFYNILFSWWLNATWNNKTINQFHMKLLLLLVVVECCVIASKKKVLEGPTQTESVIWKIGFKLLPTNGQTDRFKMKRECQQQQMQHSNLLHAAAVIFADRITTHTIRWWAN